MSIRSGVSMAAGRGIYLGSFGGEVDQRGGGNRSEDASGRETNVGIFY